MVSKSKSKSKSKSLTKANSSMVLNNAKGYLYTMIVSYVLVIIYVSYIIYYLNTLKNCKCYQDKDRLNYSNITYLVIIESLIIAINIIAVISLLFVLSYMNKSKSGGGSFSKFLPYYVILAVIFLISLYFIYYVYKLSENIDPNCPCSQSWLRYLLYIQAVIIGINMLSVIYSLTMMHK